MSKDVISAAHNFRERDQPRKKVLESVEVKRSANGGFIARHRFDNSGPGSGYHDPEENTFDSGHEMLAHLAKHMGIKAPAAPKAAAAAKATEPDGDE